MVLFYKLLTSDQFASFGGIDEPLTRITLCLNSNIVQRLVILQQDHGSRIHGDKHGVLAEVDVDENVGWFEISQKDLFVLMQVIHVVNQVEYGMFQLEGVLDIPKCRVHIIDTHVINHLGLIWGHND